MILFLFITFKYSNSYNIICLGSKTLQAFLDLMSNTLVKEDTIADVIEAFKVYDKDGNGIHLLKYNHI